MLLLSWTYSVLKCTILSFYIFYLRKTGLEMPQTFPHPTPKYQIGAHWSYIDRVSYFLWITKNIFVVIYLQIWYYSILCIWNVNEMYPVYIGTLDPITYYLPVCYLLRIQKYPVNTTYNKIRAISVCNLTSEKTLLLTAQSVTIKRTAVNC